MLFVNDRYFNISIMCVFAQVSSGVDTRRSTGSLMSAPPDGAPAVEGPALPPTGGCSTLRSEFPSATDLDALASLSLSGLGACEAIAVRGWSIESVRRPAAFDALRLSTLATIESGLYQSMRLRAYYPYTVYSLPATSSACPDASAPAAHDRLAADAAGAAAAAHASAEHMAARLGRIVDGTPACPVAVELSPHSHLGTPCCLHVKTVISAVLLL
jgi:hypothetical protein